MMHRRVRTLIGTAMIWVLLAMVVPPAMSQEYKIGPGDVLDINVLGESSVSGNYTVSPDGKIALPLAGDLVVGGLTTPEVAAKVTDALKAYLKEPRVTVSVHTVASSNTYVYVLGQVTHPGSYKMERGWTLAELFAAASGTTSSAALTQAFILRNNQTIPINLDALLIQGNTSANMPLQAGDVVIVPQSKNQVTVSGAVVKPGDYTFKAGDRVIDALTAAGGASTTAKIHDIGVIRQDDAKKTATVVHIDLDKFYKSGDPNQNVPLLPGDIVYVPAKSSINWLSVVSSITGIATVISIFR